MPLPYVPPPNSDELLSSWIERIGLFYGIGYLRARVMLDPTRIANVWGENEDVDSSEDLRLLLCSLTGYGDNVVPRLLPSTSDRILDVSARLTYCHKCWNEDAENGRAPYIRSEWSSWSNVLCTKHETWLSARRPGNQYGSELNGWAPVWQTDSTWAFAAYLRHDLAMSPFALGFDAKSILPPTCEWKCVGAEFQALVRDKALVLELASRPASSSIRAHVREAVEVARNPHVTDLDLRGYRRAEPGWIADRICCLSVAAEIRRMIMGNEPAFARVRAVLESDPSARKLLLECRSHMRRTHDLCHFPASRKADVQTRQRQAHRY
jgi:hypothetical protein